MAQEFDSDIEIIEEPTGIAAVENCAPIMEIKLNPAMLSRRQSGQRRLSLFDIEDIKDNKKKNDKHETKSKYEKLLPQEADEWAKLLDKKQNEVKQLKSATFEIDDSVLGENMKIYFRNSIDFDKFAKDSTEFCEKANKYLHDFSDLNYLNNDLLLNSERLFETLAYDIKSKCLSL